MVLNQGTILCPCCYHCMLINDITADPESETRLFDDGLCL